MKRNSQGFTLFEFNASIEAPLMKDSLRDALTRPDVVVIACVIAILAGLMLPRVGFAREAANKLACANSLRQIGMAELEYEQSYRRLSSYNIMWGNNGHGRWSGFIALLPYLDREPLYSAFQDGAGGYVNGKYTSWGPYGSVANAKVTARRRSSPDLPRYTWSSEYRLNRTQVRTFRCPSDSGKIRPNSLWNSARTNYAFCLGDGQIGINGTDPIEASTRGAFQRNRYYAMSDIRDGAANTIMFGEIATPEVSSFAVQGKGTLEMDAKVQGRAIYELALRPDMKGIAVQSCRQLSAGGRYPDRKPNWGNIGVRNYDALATYTGFNTINGPNNGSCTPTDNPWGEGEGIYTATSYHFGGAHVAMFDSSVKFINDGISTSDNRTGMTADDYYAPGRQLKDGQWQQTPNWDKESPFGVWGAMGTKSSHDRGIARLELE